MSKEKKSNFIFNWILINQLAIGNSPGRSSDLKLLQENKIVNIIGLCSQEEGNWHENIHDYFECERIVLPDSRSNKLPCEDEIKFALKRLEKSVSTNITFIHCFASIERSPLICILLMMKKYKLNMEDALAYIKRVHKYTNPTNKQLNLIKKLNF